MLSAIRCSEGRAMIPPFRRLRSRASSESAEKTVFSAMHDLVGRLAAAEAATVTAFRPARRLSRDSSKHTGTPSVWRFGIVPDAGVKIP
jgi:hypothetical protein